MKFLVIGLGSMGKRRIRNLQYLKAGEIFGFDPRQERREEVIQRYGIKVCATFEAALKLNPDALIISTPPDLHMSYALLSARAGKHFFTEASVVPHGMKELIELCRNGGFVAAPSCTMRFHPLILKIKELMDGGKIGKPLALTYHSGQYLPDWHPWEDYRRYYVAKRETGACREIVPFELSWLTWIFGPISQISCFKDKTSALDVDIDDVYQVLLKFKGGLLGHLLVDVVARAPTRSFRLLGQEGVIEWVWSQKCIRVFMSDTKEWTEINEPASILEPGYQSAENMYIEEMRAFLSAIYGESSFPISFEEDLRTLGYLYGAEKSSDESRSVLYGESL